ncbi:uncharacterized protein LOC110030778 [Phalaenopsis equestris]|uniref:uncharacterized protein LOC110030778 n=1 Tax=Phalaenopsis equestris TaxID=78828 RepID=UPI0009E4E558|nr:uncharacterized protein LOC110030778 [Phalaenopsis equestris]
MTVSDDDQDENSGSSWTKPYIPDEVLIHLCIDHQRIDDLYRTYFSMFHDDFRRSNFQSMIPAVFMAEVHFPACFEDYTLDRLFSLNFPPVDRRYSHHGDYSACDL